MSLTRRSLLIAGAASLLAAPAQARRDLTESDWVVGIIPDTPFNIQLMDMMKVPPQFRRQYVQMRSNERVGTIIVDAQARHIFQIQENGRALRFGIAVGRAGAEWHGVAVVGRRARWPTWTPTANMRRRNPNLPRQVPGGPENPLGARALYLYKDGRDTLFRIHGTNEPWSIGKAASSGCIRMFNEDVLELFGSTPVGTRVIVR